MAMTHTTSSDLVKRARQEANWSIRPPEHRKIISELADRIEALEAAAAQPSQREAALVIAMTYIADGSLRQEASRTHLGMDPDEMARWFEWFEQYAKAALAAFNPLSPYDTPAVTSEPDAPHDGRAKVLPCIHGLFDCGICMTAWPRGKDLEAAEDRSIGMTAKAIGEGEAGS